MEINKKEAKNVWCYLLEMCEIRIINICISVVIDP